MRYITSQAPIAKVRPDQKVVFLDDWPKPVQRLLGTTKILRTLVKIAENQKAA
jgi:transcription-repair coupling factor (superfamily II helicase)